MARRPQRRRANLCGRLAGRLDLRALGVDHRTIGLRAATTRFARRITSTRPGILLRTSRLCGLLPLGRDQADLASTVETNRLPQRSPSLHPYRSVGVEGSSVAGPPGPSKRCNRASPKTGCRPSLASRLRLRRQGRLNDGGARRPQARKRRSGCGRAGAFDQISIKPTHPRDGFIGRRDRGSPAAGFRASHRSSQV
jgi:hypothetical protein